VNEGSPVQATVDRQAIAEHLKSLASKRLQQLLTARAALEHHYSADGLHDVRVASRRLRAFLGILQSTLQRNAKSDPERSFRGIAKATGRLRDMDVQARDVGERAERALDDVERAALEAVLDRVQARRARRRKKALAELKSIGFDAIERQIASAVERAIRRLKRFDDEELEAFVHGSLKPMIEQVCLPLQNFEKASAAAELHQRRLVIKQLRYSLEVFRPALGVTYESVYDRLKDAQRLLGEHRDRSLLEERLERRLARLQQRGCTLLSTGIGRALGRLAEERSMSLQRIGQALGDGARRALQADLHGALPCAGARGPGIASTQSTDSEQVKSA
jgi:CHAD domain-containing protein